MQKLSKSEYENDRCNTVIDVLSHSFFYDIIKGMFKDTYLMNDENKIESKIVEHYLIEIFSNKDLYKRFVDLCRNKFLKYPIWTFSQKQIFSSLMSFDYLRETLSFLPLDWIELFNKKLTDILEQWISDDFLDVQDIRKKLMKDWIPLLDSEWVEIIAYKTNDEIIKEAVILPINKELTFDVVLNIDDINDWLEESNNYYVMLKDWTEVKDYNTKYLTLLDLQKAVIWNKKTYFKSNTQGMIYFFDEKWITLKDDEWNWISEIVNIFKFWDRTIVKVESTDIEWLYFIDLDTLEQLRLTKDWEKLWLIRQIEFNNPINYKWIDYFYASLVNLRNLKKESIDSTLDTFLIDSNWNVLMDMYWNEALYITDEIRIIPKAFKDTSNS